MAAYRRDLQRLLCDSLNELPNRAALLAHLADLRQNYAPATAARAAAAIRGFYRFLHAEGVLAEDPSEGLLGARLEQRLPKVLSRRGIEALLDVTTPSGAPGDNPLGWRNHALLHVLYATGCRVSEAVGLELGALLHDHGFLRVRGLTQVRIAGTKVMITT